MPRPSRDQIDGWLVQWREWLAARTDELLSVEERVKGAGGDEDRVDTATAFVVRKAVAERLDDVAACAASDTELAARRAGEPVTDDLGGPVAAHLDEAAVLLDALLRRIDERLRAVEQRDATSAAARHRAEADLAVAERLSVAVGMHAGRVAALRARLDEREPTHLVELADAAASMRAELEAAERGRAEVLARWDELPGVLERLAVDEAAVRELAARCREKVRDAPNIAVPATASIVVAPTAAELASMPWPAARRAAEPVIERVDRLGSALAEARRRFQAALDERDELRGLVQAFRDKAGDGGIGETTDVEAAYERAKALLWSAPCDLVAGRDAVDGFVALVNERLRGRAAGARQTEGERR